MQRNDAHSTCPENILLFHPFSTLVLEPVTPSTCHAFVEEAYIIEHTHESNNDSESVFVYEIEMAYEVT